MNCVESKIRTNKVWCTSCHRPFIKGDTAHFVLNDEGEFKEVHCDACFLKNVDLIEMQANTELHPFSEEAVQGPY